MKPYLVLLVIFLFHTMSCDAQDIQKFEGEVSAGLTIPLNNYHNGEKLVGPDLGIELRYNIPHSSWDCGISLNASTSVYKYEESPNTDWYNEQSNRSINLLVVGDYNIRQGSKFNPFIGGGFGFSMCEAINEVVYKSSGYGLVFRPRIGIELFRHLRISTFATINRKGYNNIGISLGAVIGGRPKL